jgi:methanethiol S-methyltransferase
MGKRLLFMGYATVAYVIFLATFLYAIGFVGGFLAPTQLDAPSRDPLAVAVGIDVSLLAIFALQHKKWSPSCSTRKPHSLLPPGTMCNEIALRVHGDNLAAADFHIAKVVKSV